MQIPEHIEGFQWDQANKEKHRTGRNVAWQECEEVFFNVPLYTYPDLKHSEKESRHGALGQTNTGRLLFVVFTARGTVVRVIYARDMNKKEREVYHEKAQKDSNV